MNKSSAENVLIVHIVQIFWIFLKLKMKQLENGLFLDKVFVAVIRIGIQASCFVKWGRISFRWTHVDAEKAEKFPNAHKSVLKATGTSVFVAGNGK